MTLAQTNTFRESALQEKKNKNLHKLYIEIIFPNQNVLLPLQMEETIFQTKCKLTTGIRMSVCHFHRVHFENKNTTRGEQQLITSLIPIQILWQHYAFSSPSLMGLQLCQLLKHFARAGDDGRGI